MRRLSCLHTHTLFCDGAGTVEDYCASAAAKGFSVIGFSAHAPLDLQTGWHLPMARFEAYREAVRAAQKKWAGTLAVYLGLEADYIEGISSPGQWNQKEYGLDYVIGSVHYIPTPQGGLYEVDGDAQSFHRLVTGHFDGDALEVARVYYHCVEQMIQAGGFDILGHFDLIKKNNRDNTWFSLDNAVYRQALEAAAAVVREAAAERPFAVEVNTGAIARGSFPDTYPSLAAMRMMAGVPFIITADAHNPNHLGVGYDLAIVNLREAGRMESAFFEGRGADNKPRWSFSPL
jgi:histidinol-phosphatase (PHP family)